jgi:hypothetical protein
MQVELDALPRETLKTLYQEAITARWNGDMYQSVRAREDAEREQLQRLGEKLS